MKRRQFLAGAGSLFVAGCATSPKSWNEVPWVGPVASAPPPSPLPRPYVAPPRAPCAVAPRACPPPACVSPTARLPGAAGAGWTLVHREAWGAAPLKSNHDPMGAITRITLHHTDEHSGMCGRADAEVVRAIQAYHQGTQGWADIGYHYLVGRDGRIYEGRAVTAQGAHAGGANNKNNLGISVIGNFSRALPVPAQLAALRGFLADRKVAYGIRGAAVLGHRDLGNTECPGDALYAWLQKNRGA